MKDIALVILITLAPVRALCKSGSDGLSCHISLLQSHIKYVKGQSGKRVEIEESPIHAIEQKAETSQEAGAVHANGDDQMCIDHAVVDAGRFPHMQHETDDLFHKLDRNQSSGSFILDAICYGGACNDGKFHMELSGIMPYPHNVLLVLHLARCYNWLNVTLRDLDHYISFTRFARGFDKVFCDWCSITNGVSEMLTEKLKHVDVLPALNSTMLENTPACKAAEQHNLDMSSPNTPSTSQLAAYNLPAKVVNPILTFRNWVEWTESRWCPFRHLRKMSFNRSYYAFTPEEKDELLQAQAILREKKRITGEDVTCESCNKVINEQLRKFRPGELSIFEDAPLGLSYMDRLKCAFGIECSPVAGLAKCASTV